MNLRLLVVVGTLWPLAAAPIIESSGTVKRWGESYEIGEHSYVEASSAGPTYDLLVGTYGTGYGYAYGRLTGELGSTHGTIRGDAQGYERDCGGACWTDYYGWVQFDSLLQGTYVVTGGTGMVELRLGDIGLTQDGAISPLCSLQVNGETKGCGDSFAVAFGDPLQLALRFSAGLWSSSWPADFFEFSYSLETAYDAKSGATFAMSEYAPAAVPEPSAVWLVGLALTFGFWRRRAGRAFWSK